jgi:hypothetical protein
MKGCSSFGTWADAVRGDLPPGDGFRAAVHARTCAKCTAALAEARRLHTALRSGLAAKASAEPPHEGHEDLLALATAIARREFPSTVWRCAECTEVMIASVDPEAAGPKTRRWVLPASSLAAAAAVLAFVWLGEPSEEWARVAGLRRGQAWLLPEELAVEVARTAERGALAAPRFELPTAPLDIERDPFLAEKAPRVVSPRWEVVRDRDPEFRFERAGGGPAEVVLLDGERRFVARFDVADGRGRLPKDAPRLARGATYYWKVNARDGDDVHASAYAGFTVLAEADEARCGAWRSRARGSPFLRAVAAERCGFYTEASAAFDEAARAEEARAVVAPLAEEIRRRQGIEAGDAGRR